MSIIDEAGDYYRTTVSSQLSHQDILKVIFYMYYVTGCPYQILTAFDKCQWNGGIPSSFYQIMIVFKQAGDYFMVYSCLLSITYWWTWTNGRFNQRVSYFRIISAFTSDRGCPASINYLMAFSKVRNISEVVLFLSHYFAFQQEEFEDTKRIIRIRKLKVRQHNGQKKKDEGTNSRFHIFLDSN